MSTRKVLISLVGGQSYPIYAQLMNSNPDILLLVHSDRTHDIATYIERLVISKRPQIKVTRQKLSAQDHKQDDLCINAMVNVWCKPENDVWINLIGGTKHWSLLFYKHFQGHAHFVVIDQNNKELNLDTLEETHVEPLITIDEIFGLHGVEATYRSINEYTLEDLKCVEQIERLRQCNYKVFNMITRYLSEHPNETEYEIESCYIRETPAGYDCHFERTNSRGFTHQANETLTSSHARQLLLNTGWFEYKVANVISRWYEVDQVWLNCEIKTDSDPNPINELDIVVLTKSHKWLMVECKTQIYEGTNIDKFSEVVRKYTGIGSKKIFVTEKLMGAKHQSRCKFSQIDYFNMEEILSNINAFYDRLSKLMITINPQ